MIAAQPKSLYFHTTNQDLVKLELRNINYQRFATMILILLSTR